MPTTTTRVSSAVQRFEQTQVDDDNALFHCDMPEGRYVLIMPRTAWEDYGAPPRFVVTTEPVGA